MTEAEPLQKTGPVLLLESRRAALVKWLEDGQSAIKIAEDQIVKHKQEAIEMLAEVEQIEAALETLYAAQKTENAE